MPMPLAANHPAREQKECVIVSFQAMTPSKSFDPDPQPLPLPPPLTSIMICLARAQIASVSSLSSLPDIIVFLGIPAFHFAE